MFFLIFIGHIADEKWYYIKGLLEIPCVVYEKSENN